MSPLSSSCGARPRWRHRGASGVSILPHGLSSRRLQLAYQRAEDRAETQHHAVQRRGNDHRDHHRLRHLCHAHRCGQGDGLSRPLPHRLVRLRSDFYHGRPVLRRAGHDHRQVGGGLHLHLGGVRRTGGLSEAVGGDAHHPAVVAVCGVAGVCHLPPETSLPELPCARQRCEAHRLLVSQ